MRFEFYFYKNDTEMLMDQGAKAIMLGPGNDWKVIYSGAIPSHLYACPMDIPEDARLLVIIQNNTV